MSDEKNDAYGSKGEEDETDAKVTSSSKTDYKGAKSQSRTPRIAESDFRALRYKMDHPRRGVAVIISNTIFKANTQMKPITYQQQNDATAMYDLLDTLGFQSIRAYDNLDAERIKALLMEVAREDHTNNDCFVCVILSYGEEGYVYATDNKIPLDELVRPFKGDVCQSLALKPKLFFIQACRIARRVGRTASDGLETGEEEVIRRIPTEADVLMAYAVIPENPQSGLWFIKTLVKVFKENWQRMDLLTMITRVNKRVANDFEKYANEEFLLYNKQIPCVTSMLTKELYFSNQMMSMP